MPKYRVETNQGNYEIELDRPPDSPEQLRGLIESELSKMFPVSPGPTPVRTGAPSGSLATPEQAQDILRSTAHGVTVGLPAAVGAGLGLTSLPATGPAGPLIGAGVGAGTGQAAWGAIEPFLPQALFGPSEAPKTLPEQFGAVGREALMGPAYEIGGQVAGRGLQAAIAPRAGKVTPQGRQLLQTGEQAGFTPSPADVAPGGMIRRVEALAEKQFGGGAITRAGEKEIETMRGSAATGVEGWLTRRAREVGTPAAIDASRVSRGETIQAGLQDIAQAHRVGEAVEWEFPRMKETGVPDFRIDELREYMRGRVAERADLRQAISPPTRTRLSSPGGKIGKEGAFVTERATRSGMTSEEMVAGLAQGEGPITLRQAMTLRKALGEMYESGDRGPLAAFRKDMDADAGLNPKRAEAWQKARQYTKEWIVPFRGDEPLGRLIDKKEPLAVVQELMQPRDARINMLRAIHKQTGAQGPVWESVQAEAITQAVETPKILKNVGPETKRLLFTPEQRQFLDELQNWRETSMASMKESRGLFARTGTNIVGYDQIRHGITLLIGTGGGYQFGGAPGAVAAGTTVLLAPAVVGKLLTNPTTARWLAQGFKTSAGSAEAIRISSQILPRYFEALSTGSEGRAQRATTVK